MPRLLLVIAGVCFAGICDADVLRSEPERVFDGERMREGWIVVEGSGELWATKLVRHDRNFRLDGTEISRNGGETPEVFCKLANVDEGCL
ncbi:MAG: hypothetical protein AAF417_05515 [Pseudomonadota bacterium]